MLRRLERSLAILLVLVIILMTAQPAFAAILISSDTVNIPATRTIDDDVYIGGGNVTINGRINGDLVVAGGNVTVNGTVRDDLIAAGGNIVVNGDIGQTIRGAGGSVMVNGDIGEDLVVGGGTVTTSENTTVGRDALLGAGTVTLSGAVQRNLTSGSGRITIDGTVGGNARLYLDGGQLTLTDRARIGGDLVYTSENEASIASGAQVAGEISREEPPVRRPTPAERTTGRIIGFIISYLATLLLALALLFLFPRRVDETGTTVIASPWVSLLTGLALLLLVPILVVILLVFVITIPIALTILFFYAFGLYLAKAFVGLALGKVLSRYVNLGQGNVIPLLIGLFIVMLIGLIPIIGPVARFLYYIFGLGAGATVIYKAFAARRAAQHPEQPPEETRPELP